LGRACSHETGSPQAPGSLFSNFFLHLYHIWNAYEIILKKNDTMLDMAIAIVLVSVPKIWFAMLQQDFITIF